MRENGVLIGAAGRGNAALKVRPPLPVTRPDIDFLLDVFARVLASESSA